MPRPKLRRRGTSEDSMWNTTLANISPPLPETQHLPLQARNPTLRIPTKALLSQEHRERRKHEGFPGTCTPGTASRSCLLVKPPVHGKSYLPSNEDFISLNRIRSNNLHQCAGKGGLADISNFEVSQPGRMQLLSSRYLITNFPAIEQKKVCCHRCHIIKPLSQHPSMTVDDHIIYLYSRLLRLLPANVGDGDCLRLRRPNRAKSCFPNQSIGDSENSRKSCESGIQHWKPNITAIIGCPAFSLSTPIVTQVS